MEPTLEDFLVELRQAYLSGTDVNSNFQLAEFMSIFTNDIIENGDLEGYEFCHYDTTRGIRVDGFYFDDEGGLSLFIADFDFREQVESLTQTDVTNAFKRLVNFFQASFEKALWQDMERTSAEYGLSRQISDRKASILKLSLFLVSDRRLSDRAHETSQPVTAGIPTTYHIWDISRLFRQRSSRGQREPLEIDFQDMFGAGIPCLSANVGSSSYSSYLLVMPGKILADLYGKFGARLLEQNVRAFLQNRGAVNKGIRTTILREPGMFFAYNNGITATATEVDTESSANGTAITRVVDLQIVNGGQTTASLFHTRRTDRVGLGEIFVQMKLSVIDPAESERVVPRIAEYANTQNKVNAADLFSNSPFHIRMEELSRRTLAPPMPGSIRQTKWFYERTRGQYADEMSKRTPAEQNRFAAEYPKAQVINKTDIAKFENCWDEHPRYVNLGAQKNFAEYAKRIAKEWEAGEDNFNDYYFKRAVVRGIVFRATEKLVSAQPWYDGGYRANLVAYGIACISEIAKRKGQVLSTDPNWKSQEIPQALHRALVAATTFANTIICDPPQGISNVGEWCKREACWIRMLDRLEELQGQFDDEFWPLLTSKDSDRADRREARHQQNEISGIQAQAKVMETPKRIWVSIREQLSSKRLLSQKELDILGLVTRDPQEIPTARQSAVLLEILGKAESEGII